MTYILPETEIIPVEDRTPPPSSKYNHDVLKAIEQSLRLGNSRKASAEYAGIARDTFYQWLNDPKLYTFEHFITQGEGKPNLLVKPQPFKDMIRQAEADGAHRNVAIIAKSAAGGIIRSRRTIHRRNGDVVEEVEYFPPQWTAAAWLLERKNPEDWAQRRRDADDLSRKTDEELLAMLTANGMMDDAEIPEADLTQKAELNKAELNNDIQASLTGPTRYSPLELTAEVAGGNSEAQAFLEANAGRTGIP